MNDDKWKFAEPDPKEKSAAQKEREGMIVLLILGGLTSGTVWLVNTLRSRTQTVQGPSFNQETLLELQPKPKLQVTELQVP